MPDAWLFDVYPHPNSSNLVVWIKHGDRVYKQLVPYQPAFCVKAEASKLEVAERILASDTRVAALWRGEHKLWLQAHPEPVLYVQPKRLQDLFAVATDLRRATHSKGFLFFDVDNQPESRWMHELGLWTMCRLEVEDGTPQLCPASDDERFTVDYRDPELRTTYLQVIVDAEHEDRETFGDDLLAIRLGNELLQVGVVGEPAEERAVLREFFRRYEIINPDVVFTNGGDGFHVPYLLNLIEKHGLNCWLGRDADPRTPDQKGKSIHTYGRWLYKTPAYYLKGRWHIDLNKKTLDAEDNRKDIQGVLYLARVSNRRVQDCNRNGAGYALQQMQIDAAVDQGVAVPWKRNLTEDWKDAATLCAVDRGGQIMVPKPGVLGNVIACDFSGYYPSLIVHHNLSSDTINCDCCPDGPVVPELNYHLCTKRKGHQSGVLDKIGGHRKWAKAVIKLAKNTNVPPLKLARAVAVKSEHKALGVVCFGYFRYRNARFGCAEVHQAIQCYGRKGMTDARRVTQEMGYDMVHAMTDCTFLQHETRRDCGHEDAVKVARAISKKVGVIMDVEGVYRWIVFLPSKVHSQSDWATVGVPNRYYGKFEDGSLKLRGIEMQRHSTPNWIWVAQEQMLEVLRTADTPEEFLANVPPALQVAKRAAQMLLENKVRPEDLTINIQATKEVEEYQASTKTRTALHRLRAAGTERKPGEYIQYVVTRPDGPKEGQVVPLELFGKENWFGVTTVSPSHAHYLRLLARSVETLLGSFGYQEENVLRWLLGQSHNPVPKKPAGFPRRVDLQWRRT